MFKNLFGRMIGQAGGALSAVSGGRVGEGLRSAGGQLTGGQRTFNVIPTANAAGPAPQVLGSTPDAFAQNQFIPQANVNFPSGQPGGGGGSGQPQLQQPGGGGQPTEGTPQEPQFDFGAINEALGTLESLEGETRSLLGGGEQQAESFRTEATGRAQQAKEKGVGAVSEQERKTGFAGREAETQQRRGFSEIAQQFLGRFGRTGFGQGVTGALGESTLQNVGRIRAGVQETMQQLFTQKQEIETQLNTAIEQASFQSEQIKTQAKAQLQSALADIGSRRVALQSQKAQLVNQALEGYRQQVLDVNARNAAFQQQIELSRVRTDEAIREAQSRATNVINNLAEFSLAPGETRIMPISQLGGETGAQGFAGTQLPGGAQFSKAGQFGIFSGQQEQNPLQQLLQSEGINVGD